jgi:hypothetical protein
MAQQPVPAYQIACEGKADEVFYRRLLNEGGRTVGVHCPAKETGSGITNIHHTLISFQAQYEAIKRIVLLVDADDNPQTNFEEAQKQIRLANERNLVKPLPVPEIANTFSEIPNAPQAAIVVAPGVNSYGCLDTLLLPSFEEVFNASLKCVNSYCECVKDDARGRTKDSKIRLRILIATAFPKTPGLSLANLLEESNCPIGLTHVSFNAIKNILINLFP